MKQHATIEQWGSLTDFQRLYFWKHLKHDLTGGEMHRCNEFITIGILIEFIGEDFRNVIYDIDVDPENLFDKLWDIVEYKLKLI